MRIETERLVLREFTEADAATMLAYWRDPRYGCFNPERTDAETERFVHDLVGRFVAQRAEQPRRKWQLAIGERTGEPMIGNAGIRVNDPELGEANIGYELNPLVWGRGYATEAAGALLRFGFAELGLHRVWAECVADNAASARVLEKLGMRLEARFREHQRFQGRWWDTVNYAILDHEWRQQATGA